MAISNRHDAEIVTDVLIVGTGPCGSSLAAFLAFYGVKATIVDRLSCTTPEPRAHSINMGTLECLRDIGLERDMLLIATPYTRMPVRRYCHTICGEEYFRAQVCNQVPKWKSEYETSSPCQMVDVPQNDAEMILLRGATQNGSTVRWNTEYVSYEDYGSFVLATCRDLQTNKDLRIRCRYLCGADGGRSILLSQIGATMLGRRSNLETCYAITFSADMTSIINKCPSFFNFIIRPTDELNPHCMVGHIRIIRPYFQCQLIAIPVPGTPILKDVGAFDWEKLITDFIGDSKIKVNIEIVGKWRVNEVVADCYSKGNVFCLGDAVHRHPPANGLGSNTAVQDSYNLAWKLSYVLQGIASPKILDTYNTERQPVGHQVVTRANDSWRIDQRFFSAMGMDEPDLTKRQAHAQALKEDSPRGQKMRAELQEAFRLTEQQFSAAGAEMNQFYRSSSLDIDDEGVDARSPVYESDRDMRYTKGTIPGMRLPHAWLVDKMTGDLISTQDLAGKGRFTLFTGIGGTESWTRAAAVAQQELRGLKIAVFTIGWNRQYLDTESIWDQVRGVEEDGVVLVRPDRFVGWRSRRRLDLEVAPDRLVRALRKILALD